MKNYLLISIVIFITNQSFSQGCVAIRSTGATRTMTGAHNDNSNIKDENWTLGINSRYFKSHKHFVGTAEQKERVENGTEVINHSFATELSLNCRLNQRWSMGMYAPFISNTRSSMYEHYGNTSKSLMPEGIQKLLV